jgi:hypothetical protein
VNPSALEFQEFACEVFDVRRRKKSRKKNGHFVPSTLRPAESRRFPSDFAGV